MKLYEVMWTEPAREDVYALGDYVADHSSEQEAESLVARIFASTRYLAEFPFLYMEAPEWGEGMRRIPVLGQRVLYTVDKEQQIVRVVAVTGGHQNPRKLL